MDPADPTRVRLSSWKDIAAFFGRDVRTVQRWEKLEGLPVHRHLHHTQHSVYAFPDELEAWLRDRGAEPPTIVPEPPDPAVENAIDPLGPEAEERGAGRSKRPGWWVIAASTAATTALVLIVVWSRGGPGGGPWKSDRAGVLATFDATRPNSLFYAGPAGDLNGDGRDDPLFVSQEAGEVYVLLEHGIANASNRLSTVAEAADVTISIEPQYPLGATQIADFDGDGLGDLLLVSLFKEPESFYGTAPAFILRGRRTWPRTLALPRDADITFRPNLKNDIRMTACYGPPFDVNGDGIADVLLGGADYSPSADRRSAGGAFVLLGRRAWPAVVDPVAEADIAFEGSRTGEALTANTCAIADFNRDGRQDVALMSGEYTLWNMLESRGRASLWYGREVWPKVLRSDAADFRIVGTLPNSGGSSLSAADVDGDGDQDLLLGWPRQSTATSEVGIWFGGAGRTGALAADQADARIAGPRGPSEFGMSIAAADLDRDGRSDLLLATPETGRVFVVFGRSSWPKSAPLAQMAGAALFTSDAGTGFAGMRTGDLDGDSLPELMLTRWRQAGAARGWVLTPYLPVAIDVRPTHAPNILYFPRGVLVVRVPGRGSIAAAEIDPATLRLAGAGAESHVLRDFDGDGVADLQINFDTSRMRVTASTTSVVLTARTRDGRLVAGRDSVVVIASDDAAKPGVPSPAGGPPF